MALDAHLSFTTLFGSNMIHTGANPNTTLTIKLSDLGTFDDTSALTGEAIILALLQYLEGVQGTSGNRILEVRSSPTTGTKDGDITIGTSITVRVFTPAIVGPIDPDDV